MRLVVVVLALAATVLAPAAPAQSDAPHLLVRIDNDGDAFRARLLVYQQAESEPFHDAMVDLGAHARTNVRVDAGPGQYRVLLDHSRHLAAPSPAPIIVELRGQLSQAVSSAGCPGAYAVAFAVEGSSARTAGAGCLGLTHEAARLLEAAREAQPVRGRGAVSVPLPGSADRGVFADGQPFEWRAARFDDGFGAMVDAHEILHVGFGGWGYGTSLTAQAEFNASEPPEVLRYLPGSTRPLSWSRTLGDVAGSGPGSVSVTLTREIRYDDPPSHLACTLRSGLQGGMWRTGDVVASSAFCPRWNGPDWRAGAPIEVDGLTALPLYQLEESDERLLVARVLLVDGLAYPIEAQRYELRRDEPLRELERRLERFAPAGGPLPVAAYEPRPPQLARLDPLAGPADDAGMPFPLRAASEAARADPTLLDLRQVLARADAALVGASYREATDGRSGQAQQRWTLVFSAAGAQSASVVCERTPALPALPVRCARAAPPAELAGAPSIGSRDVPAAAMGFDDARARWTREATPTFALYRAWEPATLALGARAPAALAPQLPGEDEGRDVVVLDLRTGRTLLAVEVVEETAQLDLTGVGLVARRSLSAPAAEFAWEDAVPLLVGTGVGLAILAALGALLYSRLVRARVLDSATRASILDVVAAEPGLHASGIMARIGKRGGVTEHHLDVLVREGFLTALATPGFRRYFVTGRHLPQEMRAIAALREGQNEKLLRIIRSNPGIPLQTLALEAGVSVPYASRSVQKLAEAGLVEKVQVGRAVTLHAAEG